MGKNIKEPFPEWYKKFIRNITKHSEKLEQPVKFIRFVTDEKGNLNWILKELKLKLPNKYKPDIDIFVTFTKDGWFYLSSKRRLLNIFQKDKDGVIVLENGWIDDHITVGFDTKNTSKENILLSHWTWYDHTDNYVTRHKYCNIDLEKYEKRKIRHMEIICDGKTYPISKMYDEDAQSFLKTILYYGLNLEKVSSKKEPIKKKTLSAKKPKRPVKTKKPSRKKVKYSSKNKKSKIHK